MPFKANAARRHHIPKQKGSKSICGVLPLPQPRRRLPPLVTLNLLAFAFHIAAYLGVLAWRTAVVARGPTYRFFEHLRTISATSFSADWPHLLQSIAAAALRPP